MDTRARLTKTWSRHRGDLALGIERIGLLSLRFPAIVGVLAIVVAIGAGFGVARIKINDSLSQLFRSDTPQFKLYERETRLFPSSEFDVLIVVNGETLLERPSIAKLRNLVTDLQLIDGTRGIISLFSARQPPENGRLPAPLVPDDLPSGAAFQQLVQRITSNEIIRGKLLSNDGKLTLIVLALDPDAVQSHRLSRIVHDIRQTAGTDLAGTGLKASLTGVPIMQLEIRNAVERDRVIYNTVEFAAGCLIAVLFFRRVSFMIVAAGPPLTAILLGLGALGWLDFRLNLFLNIMTPLIMVISFSDSMQLTFAARDRLIAGESRYEAFRHALLVVGPACVLTHGTAALSFIALQFSQSDLIRSFGEAGLIATVIALVTVLTPCHCSVSCWFATKPDLPPTPGVPTAPLSFSATPAAGSRAAWSGAQASTAWPAWSSWRCSRACMRSSSRAIVSPIRCRIEVRRSLRQTGSIPN